ncbi:MAG: peptidoglycan editing factor PgeF [Thermomicrobiaceae bacterium]
MTSSVQRNGQETDPSQLPVFRFSTLNQEAVVHGVTTRTPALPLNGNMSFMVGDALDLVHQNRQSWAEAIGYDYRRLVLGRQVHETAVVPVDERHAGSGADSVETSIRRVDGLMTASPGLPIGVMAADCVPILIHDPVRGAVAAIHAGWRGTVEGIASEAVAALGKKYGSDPSDLKVCLGPSICRSCYEVGTEVIDRWRENPAASECDAFSETTAGLYFDLRAANQAQLRATGVDPGSIEISDLCTQCSDGTMFSRRGLGPRTGLFTSVIMVADSPDIWNGDQ